MGVVDTDSADPDTLCAHYIYMVYESAEETVCGSNEAGSSRY